MGFKRTTEPKDARIEVRLTPTEKDRIAAYAGECLITVSQFVRRRALGRRIVPRTDYKMLAELRRQGGNLRNLLTRVDGQHDKELALAMVAAIKEIVSVVDKAIDFVDDDRGD